MTREELAEKIHAWEIDAGESFTDYYMHDNIVERHWANWLIENGHEERGKYILLQLSEEDTYLGQVELFSVCDSTYNDDYQDYVENWEDDDYSEQYDKTVLVWADYFLSSKELLDDVIKWLRSH